MGVVAVSAQLDLRILTKPVLPPSAADLARNAVQAAEKRIGEVNRKIEVAKAAFHEAVNEAAQMDGPMGMVLGLFGQRAKRREQAEARAAKAKEIWDAAQEEALVALQALDDAHGRLAEATEADKHVLVEQLNEARQLAAAGGPQAAEIEAALGAYRTARDRLALVTEAVQAALGAGTAANGALRELQVAAGASQSSVNLGRIGGGPAGLASAHLMNAARSAVSELMEARDAQARLLPRLQRVEEACEAIGVTVSFDSVRKTAARMKAATGFESLDRDAVESLASELRFLSQGLNKERKTWMQTLEEAEAAVVALVPPR